MKEQTLKREIVALALVALLLVVAVFALRPLDQTLSARMRSLTAPPLVALLTVVSVFGGAAVEAALVALATLFLAWQRRWLELWFVLASTASAGILGGIIRLLIRRDRPALGPAPDLLWALIGRYSFPSGHTLFYTAFFGAMAYLLWARGRGRARWAGIVFCLALIVLVGPSRVFLGAHWPSDIAAGYLVGGLGMCGLIVFYQWRHGW